jgi:glutathione peroxidase
MEKNLFNFNCQVKQQTIPLEKYRGSIVLIINTATRCGLASQLKDLENLYQKYQEKGLIIIAFPCDQFMNQEIDDQTKIEQICRLNYNATYIIADKIDVRGFNQSELYEWLTNPKNKFGGSIKWNYTKFLFDQKGNFVKRYAPITKVSKIEKEIEHLIMGV